ncbi:MAG: N-6 DNA methylase [Verrucomicrobia bacterium]|nr:N-6 DNA methylase [Verrucomicrobiota bacterium]
MSEEAQLLHEEPPAYGGAGKFTAFQAYLRKLQQALKRGDATEHTHRPALKELIESLDATVTATNEPRRSDCGAPDFVISPKGVRLRLGSVECKDVGANLTKMERGDQLERYLPSLPNLLLTDYLEFRWFVRGEKRETFRLAILQPEGKLTPVSADELERAKDLLLAFLRQPPVTIASAHELACCLAGLTRNVRFGIVRAFELQQASQQLRDWRAAFAATLLPELAPQADAKQEATAVAEFADMFAQTLAYGLFSARAASGSTQFTREKAQRLIPRTNPFLRTFFEQITGSTLDDEPFAGFVEDIIQTLDHAELARILEDFGRRGPRRDPVVHFYETFLQAYDPKLRELRGVYYTPEPVVNYIVQSADHLLKDRFGLKSGLADHSKVQVKREPHDRKIASETHRVLILDPAAGTGTFLYSVLDFIRDQFDRRRSVGQWNSYVHEHLLPRLFGFELLMAPYAVAHFKLGLALAAFDKEPLFRPQWSYEPQGGERLNIFLTNTLEDLERAAEPLGPLRALSDEANSAYEIKKHRPVLVVLGNPPYSGHSANKGAWISGLVRDYYFCGGRPLGERNPKWLQDDYVKFIRWGQWRIEQTGQGILAFITNHGYLDNPTFRGMRQHLMRTFDEIYVLNLHGNSKKQETVPGTGDPDKNVFDIQQGVAIGIFVKLPAEARAKKKEKAPARVRHCDLWRAQRQAKYDWLDGHHVRNTEWTTLLPGAPHYLFVPQDTRRLREYERGWKVTEMMPVHGWGIATRKDYLLVDFEAEALVQKFRAILALPVDQAVQRFGIRKAPHWDFAKAREHLPRDPASSVRPVLFRPFDVRFLYYEKAMIERGDHRFDLMQHMFEPNLALITVRRIEGGGPFTHFFATTRISVLHSTSAKEGNFVFPLYLYPNGDLPEADLFAHENDRCPNLNAAFIRDFSAKLAVKVDPEDKGRTRGKTIGPERIFEYAYAVFHSPTYRERYAEFLRADFPRLPLTSDYTLFRKLAGLGGKLVDLHARGKGEPRGLSFPVEGADVIEAVRYQPPQGKAPGRVWINERQYFDKVPEAAWTFPIGGYLPAQRWLKDRIGRTLGYDEQAEYQRIIWALIETERLMAEVDSCINQHGGWPLR